MNDDGELSSDIPNGNHPLKTCSAEMLSALSCEQKTTPGTNLSPENRRGKSRSRLFLSLCCPELFLKTAQATQRLDIFGWLHNSKRHGPCMPYSGSQTLHWVVDAQYLSGSSSYSCKNISFVNLGDFVFQHESIQSCMFPNLQMALTLHQVIHQKGH